MVIEGKFVDKMDIHKGWLVKYRPLVVVVNIGKQKGKVCFLALVSS